MFDVEAKDANIAITSLKIQIYTAGNAGVAEVWMRPGTHEGFAFSSTGWTKAAEHDFTNLPGWTMAEIPESSFTQTVDIAAGSRQAFYVTLPAESDVLYSAGVGSTSAIVAEDDHIRIYEGPAQVHQFCGQTGPRVWNGDMTYMKEGATITLSPTLKPTAFPTGNPTTVNPTKSPTDQPTDEPTPSPSKSPTTEPATANPTKSPTDQPTDEPTPSPSKSPTLEPTTANPTKSPTDQPTDSPTLIPSKSPTPEPTTPQPTTPQPTYGTVVKYICDRNAQDEADICANGASALGSICLFKGVSCGGGSKVCWLAECQDASGNPPPSPVAPSLTPPTQCANAGEPCPPDQASRCNGSCTKGQNKVCE